MKMFIKKLIKQNVKKGYKVRFFICEPNNILDIESESIDLKKLHKILFCKDLENITLTFEPLKNFLTISISTKESNYLLQLNFYNCLKFFDFLRENKKYFDFEKVTINFKYQGCDL